MALSSTIDIVAFDIGGIFADIDKLPMQNLLKKHGIKEENFFDHEFFSLQKGLISPQAFFLNKSKKLSVADKILLTNFQAMLKVKNTIELLPKLKVPYLFMSNINSIHFNIFAQTANPTVFAQKFSLLSYRVGYLKPQYEFFKLLNNKLVKILLIDDKLINLTAAKKLNIKTALCEDGKYLPDILNAHQVLSD